jgi:hypothetical protein
MEPTEEEFVKPYAADMEHTNLKDITFQMDKDILDIVKILYELPVESRRVIYEFAQWEQHKCRRYSKNG